MFDAPSLPSLGLAASSNSPPDGSSLQQRPMSSQPPSYFVHPGQRPLSLKPPCAHLRRCVPSCRPAASMQCRTEERYCSCSQRWIQNGGLDGGDDTSQVLLPCNRSSPQLARTGFSAEGGTVPLVWLLRKCATGGRTENTRRTPSRSVTGEARSSGGTERSASQNIARRIPIAGAASDRGPKNKQYCDLNNLASGIRVRILSKPRSRAYELMLQNTWDDT